MTAFRASRDGVTARFAGNEASLIRDLVRQVAELVDEAGPADVAGAGSEAAGDTIGRDHASGPGAPGPEESGHSPAGYQPAGHGAAGHDAPGDDAPGDDAPGYGPAGSGPDAASGSREAGPGHGTQPGQPAAGAHDVLPPGTARSGLPGAAELDALLGISGNTELPTDPVLARLLPDGYQDDPEAAGDFRRFTESSLRSAKVAAAQTVLDTLPAGGGRVRLAAGQAEQWLQALNDVRLALGVRLGVTSNLDALAREITPGDPRLAALWVCDWLGQLQMSLVAALS